ncbi:MAG: universal stress protein [Ktedonobacterales bacterium]
MKILDRLVPAQGRAAKVIDGQHPESSQMRPIVNATRPDMLSLPADATGRPMQGYCNIIVGVTGAELDRETVSVACILAKTKKVEAFAIYGIEVPRTQPIDAEMANETNAASVALERARAIAEQVGADLEPEIVQSRSFGQSLVDESEAHGCALIILGVPYRLGHSGQFQISETADYVLKHARCKVWIVRDKNSEKDAHPERVEAAIGV